MRSLTRLPRSLRTNKVAVWGGCSYTGRAPGANRLGNCAPRKIGASWTWKVFKKGLKTLPIMPVDRCGGLAGPIGRFYRNPAKTHVFTDSCSEPKFIDPKRRTPIGGKLLANLSAADKKAVTTNEASRRNPVATTRPREKSLPDSSCPEALCRVIHLPDCVESILKFIEGP